LKKSSSKKSLNNLNRRSHSIAQVNKISDNKKNDLKLQDKNQEVKRSHLDSLLVLPDINQNKKDTAIHGGEAQILDDHDVEQRSDNRKGNLDNSIVNLEIDGHTSEMAKRRILKKPKIRIEV